MCTTHVLQEITKPMYYANYIATVLQIITLNYRQNCARVQHTVTAKQREPEGQLQQGCHVAMTRIKM